MTTPLSFCVVIPMCNEENSAERCIRAVCKELGTMLYQTALIVVNDGSHDETGNILARLQREYNRLTIVTHRENRGYGSALKTGVQHAAKMGFDYVLFMDSDLTNDPKYLPLFVDKMLDGFDVIKASRYIKGGGVFGVPTMRVIVSRMGNCIARFLYGLPIHDCTNGFRTIKTNILKQMQLRENGFAIIMEELYQAKFLAKRFCEVPYMLTARAGNAKGSSFVYSPRLFYNYLKYAIKSFLNQAPKHISQSIQGGY